MLVIGWINRTARQLKSDEIYMNSVMEGSQILLDYWKEKYQAFVKAFVRCFFFLPECSTCKGLLHTLWLDLEGGTHMLKHTGMCPQMGYFFHQKPFDMVPFWSKKSLPGGSHFTHKKCKISHFWGRNPFKMGPDLQKFWKNQTSFF